MKKEPISSGHTAVQFLTAAFLFLKGFSKETLPQTKAASLNMATGGSKFGILGSFDVLSSCLPETPHVRKVYDYYIQGVMLKKALFGQKKSLILLDTPGKQD